MENAGTYFCFSLIAEYLLVAKADIAFTWTATNLILKKSEATKFVSSFQSVNLAA